jgi:hypothetical protein
VTEPYFNVKKSEDYTHYINNKKYTKKNIGNKKTKKTNKKNQKKYEKTYTKQRKKRDKKNIYQKNISKKYIEKR